MHLRGFKFYNKLYIFNIVKRKVKVKMLLISVKCEFCNVTQILLVPTVSNSRYRSLKAQFLILYFYTNFLFIKHNNEYIVAIMCTAWTIFLFSRELYCLHTHTQTIKVFKLIMCTLIKKKKIIEKLEFLRIYSNI